MKLFDLHCDTALVLYNRGLALDDNPRHISLRKAEAYENYVQVAAVWSSDKLDDEACWEKFLKVTDFFSAQLAAAPDAVLVRDAASIADACAAGKCAFLFGVEDAKLLGGKIERLDTLHERGVRVLTLTWGGESCIGGAHDTASPLTDFGRQVVRRAFALGIVPDVSHASRAVTAEVLRLAREAGKPVIASHSNACAVRAHTRNLTDEEFAQIRDLGGIVGISLCPAHLSDGKCGLPEVAAHIRHYLTLGGEDTVCLGCDYDGISKTPEGLEDVSRLPALADYLAAQGIESRIMDKIFFENAYRFSQRVF